MKISKHDKYNFRLDNIEEPNLYRDVFPYHTFPQVTFEHNNVNMEMPKEIWITDTTFRDGQQARPPYTVDQIVKIYDFLHRLSGSAGIIRQSEFFLYSDKDKKAVEKCLEKGYKFPEVTGWIRAVKSDFELVKQMGLKETGILTSASDYHIFLKLKKTRKEALDSYLDVVRASLEAGIVPRCHFEDITRADFFGFVIPFAQELMKLSEESGIQVKIRACDTLGYGVPYANATLPRSVPKIISYLRDYAGVPCEALEWHGHNDFHKVQANATTAWLYGCAAANGTIFGFGERTGNPPLEAMIMDYFSFKEVPADYDATVITELAEYMKKEVDVIIPDNYPFVGADFNVTRAGIHADGLLKNEEIYNIFDTGKLLNRPLSVSITDKSGIAGIAHWINDYFSLKDKDKIDKGHPSILQIKKWIDKEYAADRITSISNQELLRHVKVYFPKLFKSDMEVLKNKVHDISIRVIDNLVETSDIHSTENIEEVGEKLEDFLKDHPFVQYCYITNKKGKRVTENITQPFNKAKYDKAFGLYQDFSDREWFMGPMRDGKAHVSNFYTSKIDGTLCITVSCPIRDINDEILGVLGMDIRFEDIADLDVSAI